MATTIVAATLTVKITETLSLNGQDKGSENSVAIASITEAFQRIVNVPTTEVVLLAFGTAIAAGQFIEGDVRYIRITNKDDTNFVTLVFRNEDSDEFALKLDYGHSFIYSASRSTPLGVVDTFDAAAAALPAGETLADLVDITAKANTAAVDLEVFVATI